ncbi:MAG: HD-like signal output (HDOD) protein [Granulosicoccus sp.]|jgi:HD-like signal output (HDOD) protein
MAFKSDSNPLVASADENGKLIQTAARSVSPIFELNAINCKSLCKSAVIQHVQRNDEIKPENSHRWMMYLVEGSLSLHSGKEEVRVINANTKEALQPLFQDKGAYQSARTTSVAKIVKFGREQLDILLKEQQKNAVCVTDVHVGELDNLIFDGILTSMASNTVTLPSSPEGAIKILSSFARVAGIPELAEVIQCDPGLAVHIVRTANRVDVGATESTHSIRGAITRLGVEETQRAIAELLKINTMIPSSKVVDGRLKRYVQRATLSAAIAQVLSRELPHLKPEVAMLVALSADIGELLILKQANAHADKFTSDQELATVVNNLRVIVSTWLMSAWDFPPEFQDASLKARDWYRTHNGEITYTDLVTAALLIINAEMPESQPTSIPSANNLLLARRLQQAGIDLTSPGTIIRAATSRIVTVQALLKTG